MYGKTQSEYQKKRASEANKGKVYSEKTRKKISDSRKGKSFLTTEGRRSIANANKKRWRNLS